MLSSPSSSSSIRSIVELLSQSSIPNSFNLPISKQTTTTITTTTTTTTIPLPTIVDLHILRSLLSSSSSELRVATLHFLYQFNPTPSWFHTFCSLSLHLFLIQSLELSSSSSSSSPPPSSSPIPVSTVHDSISMSDSDHSLSFPTSERESAFQLLSKWITSLELLQSSQQSQSQSSSSSLSFPPSLVQALLSIAETRRHPLRSHSLYLLLHLLLLSPASILHQHDGLAILLQGCMDIRDHTLLQTTLHTLLSLLDDATFRTAQVVRSFHVLLDPCLGESNKIPAGSSAGTLASPFSLTHLAVLTIMQSWNGLLLFGNESGGFYHYINLLSTQGKQYPRLAREILSTLFTLLGIPVPNLINEYEIEKQSVYWNECSLFVDRLGFSQDGAPNRTHMNLLTLYLSAMVMVFVKAGVPEALVTLTRHRSSDVVYLARKLLNVMSLLTDLYLPIEDRSSRALLMKTMLRGLEKEGIPTETTAIGSSLLYLYPIVQHTTFVPTLLSDYLSWISLFESILDYMCDPTDLDKPFNAMEYLNDYQFASFPLLSELTRETYDNSDLFMSLLRQTTVSSHYYAIFSSL